MEGPDAIAVVQTVPTTSGLHANLADHVEWARRAAKAGAAIALFPELSLTGYEVALAEEHALSEQDPRLEPLREVADAEAATIIVGAPLRAGTGLHIAGIVIGPGGRESVYTKRRLGAFSTPVEGAGALPPPEASVFSPGDRDPLVEVGSTRGALAICADMGDRNHALAASERHVNAYLASVFLIPSDYRAEAERLRSYAEEFGWLVAMANFGGPSGGLPSAGGSAVWGPDGQELVRLPEAGAGLGMVRRVADGWEAYDAS